MSLATGDQAVRSYLNLTIVGAILALHLTLLSDSLKKNYVTNLEYAGVPAGIAHWETGEFCPYRVNPPLPRMLAALPVLLVDADSHESSRLAYDEIPADRNEWRMGLAFEQANSDRYFDLVRLARFTGLFWSVVGALVLFRWARDLYGIAAGYIAIVLWCFGPNVLAHAQLTTPDIPATVTGITATYTFWQYLRDPGWIRAAVAGTLLGIAQLTKTTLLVLYGVWPLLWVLYYTSKSDTKENVPRLCTEVWRAALVLSLSAFVINLGYDFRGTCCRLGELRFVSSRFAGPPPAPADGYSIGMWGNRFQDSWLGSIIVPFPEDYIRGIDVQQRDFESLAKEMPSYLGGEWCREGWWYFYLYALAVKVPLGALLLCVWAIGLLVFYRSACATWRDELFLWVPALAILGIVSLQTGFSHHARYVLPVFPFVIVSTSKLGYFLSRRHCKSAVIVAGLLMCMISASLRIHPHYLSFFNWLGGGPERGSQHLLYSNIDWGQDLLFLKEWLGQHAEVDDLYLGYYGFADPRLLGIVFKPPPIGPDSDSLPKNIELLPARNPSEFGPRPGYYAVSVNLVYGMGWGISDGKGGRFSVPHNGYRYFRHFRPFTKAGYSIFIYYVTLEKANVVRRQMGLPPLEDQEGR